MAWFTREEAFNFAWSAPMRDLAKKVGCSDVALRKTLLAAGVDIPPRGYWNRVRAGHGVIQPKLASPKPGMPDGCFLKNVEPERSAARAQINEDPIPPTFAETIEEMQSRVRPIITAHAHERSLEHPYPAIQQLFNRDKRRTEGVVRPGGYRTGSYEPYFASGFERRRLKIFNSIIYSLRCFATTSYTRGSAARELHIKIGCNYVVVTLDHSLAEHPIGREIQTRKGEAGSLRLILGTDWKHPVHVWEDRPSCPLENHLAAISLCIVISAEKSRRAHKYFLYKKQIEALALKHSAETAAERDLIGANEQATGADRVRVEKELHESRRQLLSCAQDAHDAKEIRKFVTIVQEKFIETDPDRNRIEQWKFWALEVANKIDPLDNIERLLSMQPKLGNV